MHRIVCPASFLALALIACGSASLGEASNNGSVNPCADGGSGDGGSSSSGGGTSGEGGSLPWIPTQLCLSDGGCSGADAGPATAQVSIDSKDDGSGNGTVVEVDDDPLDGIFQIVSAAFTFVWTGAGTGTVTFSDGSSGSIANGAYSGGAPPEQAATAAANTESLADNVSTASDIFGDPASSAVLQVLQLIAGTAGLSHGGTCQNTGQPCPAGVDLYTDCGDNLCAGGQCEQTGYACTTDMDCSDTCEP